jgi:PAS domain S-box-containing protein
VTTRVKRALLLFLPRSFNQQVALLSALSLMVALTVFAYTVYQKQQELNEKSALAQATIVIKNFASASYRDVLLANYDEIRELLLHTAEFPEVSRITITDNHGRVISDVRHLPGRDPEELFSQLDLTLPSEAGLVYRTRGDSFEMWYPISDQGWVYMVYNYSVQSEAYLAVLRSELGTGVLLAILSALYFLGLLHRPIRELRRLIAFAKGLDVYHGRAEIHVRSTTREISELNQALNQSAARLFEQSQQILQSEAQYRRVVNNVQEVIFQTDILGRITFLNPAWEKVSGYTVAESLGRSFLEFASPAEDDSLTAAVDLLLKLSREHLHLETRFLTRHGDVRWVEVWTALVRDESSRIIGTTGTLADISSRKEAERALIAAKEAAESATRAKSQFLASMSHEIRTPMNGVLGMAQLLMDTDLSVEQRDYVRTLYQSGQGLLTIINDILDFSKIEAGKLSIEPIPFDLVVAIDEVCDLLLPQMQEKKLELVQRYAPDCPRLLIGDAGRIRQIVLNFLGNAVKFTEKGHILVEVSAIKVEAQTARLRISVTDTGIGISAAKQAQLFQQFSQADASTTRRFGGTGLGLAICKALTELMGGEVGLFSEEGKGSTFYMELSLPRQAVSEVRAEPHELAGMRVLVVDDLELNRRILREALGARGMVVQEAASASQALALMHAGVAARTPVDVAILDMHMPETDGETLGQQIMADGSLSHTRLVLLSSSSLKHDQERLRAAGFTLALLKPVRIDQLIDELEHLGYGRPRQSPAPKRPELQVLPAHMRVLLAEDNVVNQKVAARMLEKMGMTVDVVGNGLEAVRMCLQFRYDLILMDCQMPDLDGFAATREIRRLQAQAASPRGVPIIALTANTMEGDRERCLAAGMNDFLGKPIRQQDLAAMLQKYAGMKTLDRLA